MNIEELFDNEIYHNYGMLTTDDANCLINYLKTEVTEYVAELEKRIADFDTALSASLAREKAYREILKRHGERIAELEFDKANMVDRIIELEIHKTGVIGQANRIAELEEQNLNMMALFRDFYELEFNRDECWEIIKKYGGDA